MDNRKASDGKIIFILIGIGTLIAGIVFIISWWVKVVEANRNQINTNLPDVYANNSDKLRYGIVFLVVGIAIIAYTLKKSNSKQVNIGKPLQDKKNPPPPPIPPVP